MMTRRIVASAPSAWGRLQRLTPKRAEEFKQWLEAQLLLYSFSSDYPAEVGTTLQLGIDTTLAEVAHALSVDYTVFLACSNQADPWDAAQREKFNKLLTGAKKVHVVTPGPYSDGCIPKQFEALTIWAEESDKPVLLSVKYGRLSKTQVSRANRLRNKSELKIFRW